MKKKCDTTKYTAARIVGEMLGIVGRVLKSFLFNILVFVLGFGAGYSYVATRVHYHATQCSYGEYAQMICDKVNDMIELDKRYTQKQNEIQELLKHLKAKVSHDQHSECNTRLGKLLIKKGID